MTYGRTNADREKLLALHRQAQDYGPKGSAAADQAMAICKDIIDEGDPTHPFWGYAKYMTGLLEQVSVALKDLSREGKIHKTVNKDGRTVYGPGPGNGS